MFAEMIITMGVCLINLGSSDREESGDDEDDYATELGKVCKDVESSRVAGTKSKTVMKYIERFSQTQRKLTNRHNRDSAMQPGKL
jgi:hypothetical protein